MSINNSPSQFQVVAPVRQLQQRVLFPTGDVTIVNPVNPVHLVDPIQVLFDMERRVYDSPVGNSRYSNSTVGNSPSQYSLSWPSSRQSSIASPMPVAAVSEEAGTCICKLANGRNCGRMRKPGSFYCGIHKNGCKNGYTFYARRLGLDQNAIAQGGFAAIPSPRVQQVEPIARQQCDDAKESPYELPITQRLVQRISPVAQVAPSRRIPSPVVPFAPPRRIPSPVAPVVPLMQQLLDIPIAQFDRRDVMNQTCKCRVKVGHVCGRKVKPGSEYCGLHRNGCTYGYGKKSRRTRNVKDKNSKRKK
jgi:hypothetical protein